MRIAAMRRIGTSEIPAGPASTPDGTAARDAALAEFNALRAEICTRMSTVSTLVGVGFTALGAILALVVKDHGDQRLLLLVPLLAFVVNVLWAIENRQVGFIGRYIRTSLWPYLAGTDHALPSWEDECAGRRRGFWNSLRSIVTDYVMTLVFAGFALGSMAVLGDSFTIGGHAKRVNAELRYLGWALAGCALIVPFLMTYRNALKAKSPDPADGPRGSQPSNDAVT